MCVTCTRLSYWFSVQVIGFVRSMCSLKILDLVQLYSIISNFMFPIQNFTFMFINLSEIDVVCCLKGLLFKHLDLSWFWLLII